MLRAIKSPYPGLFLQPGTVEYTAGTPAVVVGSENFNTTTDSGTGLATLQNKQNLGSAPLLFAAATNIGYLVSVGLSPTTASSAFQVTDSTASAEDGNFHFLRACFDRSNRDDYYPTLHPVKSTFANPRLLAFTVTGALGASAAISHNVNEATLVRNSAGVYTLTFRSPFDSAPVVIPQILGSTEGKASVTAVTNTSCVVRTYTEETTATDLSFDLFVFGTDNNYPARGLRRTLRCNQATARIQLCQLTVSGGTPTVALGSGITVTDHGVGDFTLTLATRRQFARAPLVLASSGTTALRKIAVDTGRTRNSIRLRTFSNAAIAADPTLLNILMLGFDTEDIY